ncbi:DUF1822 family protein [Leptolyngbya sp. BC1307]|uniref:DUF1822 family protein n=1 Tax=Leptolyngbya sp. BC1307 TaxID=2029589 RepID=UPI0019822015|nr:DUF1822 family protein [Leptolyngbya sp. BC1307]
MIEQFSGEVYSPGSLTHITTYQVFNGVKRMVTESYRQTGITLPITTEFKQIAQQFAQQCPLQAKAQQIWRNTIAVCTVNAYLQLMEIPTRIDRGDSWNPLMQMLTDVADLDVPAIGLLSCRPLTPEADTCYVPPEAWHHRTGYIAVVIDEAANQATLLGFTPTVEEEQVALERFEPLEAVIDRLHSRETATASFPEQVQSSLTQLSQWAQGIIAANWQTVEALINPAELSFAFRTTATAISRARTIDLSLQLGQSVQVALVVHLTQSESRTDIILQVRPLGESPYLMAGLTLTVLDEHNNTFMSVTSTAIDNYIQLRLSGQPGEIFGVRVSVGDADFQEQFVI